MLEKIFKQKHETVEPITVSKKTPTEIVSQFEAKHRKSKKNIDKNRSSEKLKIIADSLRTGLNDQSLLVFDSLSEMSLDKVSLKRALDELLGNTDAKSSSTSLAYVLVDESGALFSDDLIQEEMSSATCIQRIQRIIEMDGAGALKKPLILITDTDEKVKIVFLRPAESSPEVKFYFLDAFSGSRDIRSQNKSQSLFEKYIRLGSDRNRIKPITGLVDGLSTSVRSITGCQRKHDSGWWCLYWCLMFIYEGCDPTRDDNSLQNWACKETTERLKTIIATYVDFIQKSTVACQADVIECTPIDLTRLVSTDNEIRNELELKSRNVNEKIDNLIKLSPAEQLKHFQEQEEVKLNECQVLKGEIEQLENLIKQTEGYLSSVRNKSGIATTELKFKHLVSGDQRRLFEAQMKKKEEKLKENLLANNQNIRENNIREQIGVVEKLLDADRKAYQQQVESKRAKMDSVLSFEQKKSQYLTSIEKSKTTIGQCNTAICELKAHKQKLTSNIEEINNVDLYNQTNELIRVLKKTDHEREISQITKKLENLKDKLKNLQARKTNTEKKYNQDIDEKGRTEITLDSANSQLIEYKNNKSRIESNKITLKARYDEHMSWSNWNVFTWGNGDQYKLELDREINRLNEISNTIDKQKRYIDSLDSKIKEFTLSINKNRQEISSFDQQIREIENSIRQQLESLREKRDVILDDLKNSEKKILKDVQSKEIKRIECQKDISTLENQIKLDQSSIDRLKDEIKNFSLIEIAYEKKIQDSENEIRKLKQSLSKTFSSEELANQQSVPKSVLKPSEHDAKKIEKKAQYFDSNMLSLENEKILTEMCDLTGQKWKLLYRASRDGFDAKNFHARCNSKHNTLTLITSSNGNIFGGFTSAAWSQDDCFVNDEHAYIFSVTNGKRQPFKVECLNSIEAIYCSEKFGPCFGYDDIKIADKADVNVKSSSNLGYTYEHDNYRYGSSEAQTILAGAKNFQVHEIEVFQKDYEPLCQELIEKYIRETNMSATKIKDSFEIFNAIAKNEEIGKKEFVAFLEKKINFFKNEKELKEMRSLFEMMFNRFDADNSGKLDFEEFLISIQMFNAKDASEIPKIVFNFFFEMADKDKNGKLDIKELEDLLCLFPNNHGLQKLQKNLKAKLSKSNVSSSVTKKLGIKLFCRYYSEDNDSDDSDDDDEENDDWDEYDEDDDDEDDDDEDDGTEDDDDEDDGTEDEKDNDQKKSRKK